MYESSRYHLDAADEFSEGLRRLSAGENNAAAENASAAITLDPDHWSAYFRRAEAYGRLGLEEQANADLERAEFLMAAARQEMPKRMGFPDNAGTDFSASAGVSLGRVVGGIVGGVAGFVAGCVMGVLYFLRYHRPRRRHLRWHCRLSGRRRENRLRRRVLSSHSRLPFSHAHVSDTFLNRR